MGVWQRPLQLTSQADIKAVTSAAIVEIDRNLAGVMSASGMLTSNSDSTESTRLTISSELRPTERRSSSEDAGNLSDRSVNMRLISAVTLSIGELMRRSSILVLSDIVPLTRYDCVQTVT